MFGYSVAASESGFSSIASVTGTKFSIVRRAGSAESSWPKAVTQEKQASAPTAAAGNADARVMGSPLDGFAAV